MTSITYYGHSCFGVEHQGIHLLFDPFITGNPAASHIDISKIPADYILISHGHLDHVLDVEAVARRTGAKIISTFEVVTWFGHKGLENHQAMNHGGTCHEPFGFVKIVNAVHSSSMPDGSYGGNPAGFVIGLKDGPTFYYSGDTALSYDMKLIGDEFHLDFAMLCLGDHYTMGIEDAVRAAEFVGAHKVIGMHFDTFPPIAIEHKKALAAFSEVGRDLILPKIGQVIPG
ncbi:MAG: metal-dependent hydrolase [Rhodospirillales bacterium]|nr:metal-dependent hydrolase [Rhodospirillales bacterium]MCB9965902.1 metal-dependent hydrolase [Rhodospirillales bacterium]